MQAHREVDIWVFGSSGTAVDSGTFEGHLIEGGKSWKRKTCEELEDLENHRLFMKI